jgi:hypothetical protein
MVVVDPISFGPHVSLSSDLLWGSEKAFLLMYHVRINVLFPFPDFPIKGV